MPQPRRASRAPYPHEVLMRRIIWHSALTLSSIGLATAAVPRAPESIVANDNRHAAGSLERGVLTLKLQAREGVWHPEGERGRGVPAAAWAEEGKALSAPGPLVRVPVGTQVHATLRNSLDTALTVFGFGRTRGMSDSVVIPAGATRDVQFKATTPGTYYYVARRGMGPFGARREADMELSGAIVVDAPGAHTQTRDRVFVLSWW